MFGPVGRFGPVGTVLVVAAGDDEAAPRPSRRRGAGTEVVDAVP
ncbi:MAG TPA: hypothetical protein VII46_01915 [Acidimicrobiales bacterium]